MSKEARKSIVLADEAQEKFDQCVVALAAMRWPDGPPVETTFAEIEQFGHEVGRMLGRAVDHELANRHAEHFQHAAACPTCQTVCQPKGPPAEREIQTSDGPTPLQEPVFRCSVCHRDFFPSASGFEN